MKLIGYWIRSLKDHDFPPPQELRTNYDPLTREAIGIYLDAGYLFEVYRGSSWCRFLCDHPMGNCELTDGEWVWPEGLSHYVREHSVRLPDEFVARVHSEARLFYLKARRFFQNMWLNTVGRWIVERWWVAGPRVKAREDPDEAFWKAWCAAHRSNSLKSRLHAARQRAEAEAKQIMAEAIAKLEQSEGLSQSICQWLGCNNRALAGRVVCASCSLKPDSSMRTCAAYMNLKPVLVDDHTGSKTMQ